MFFALLPWKLTAGMPGLPRTIEVARAEFKPLFKKFMLLPGHKLRNFAK
jgi:hypothetical protein